MEETQSTGRKVGAFLGIGILLLPFAFVWPLLRRGYSVRARLVGFAWLLFAVVIVSVSRNTPPDPAPGRRNSEQSSVRTSASPEVAFVARTEIDVKDAPDGATVNQFYRGQRLEIFSTEGEWVRITSLSHDPRWVRRSDLSQTQPGPLLQPGGAGADDPRLAALPRVGEYGHSEADVLALRAGARELLASGACSRIDDANKSVNASGLYYVNCGEVSNRFFRMEGGRPRFCGRMAEGCR